MSFQKRLASHEFAVLAEIHTPKGINISRLINDARRLKGRIDAVIVPDMENGIMRMSALAGGVLLQQQGVETIMHMYCRDRNRMALQGDALAAHVLGIQNIIVADSADMSESDHSDAQAVSDLNETDLIKALKTLQKGKDLSGFDLDGAPDFTIGCTLAPFSSDQELNQALEQARAKIEAGARYIITPPVFDIASCLPALEKIKTLGVPVIATVFLLKSLAIAQYIANSEPGANITDELIRRIRKSSDREQEGIAIAGENIIALKDKVQGVVIQTLGWEHKLPEILDVAGI
ncbi:methylenetetrahydrofolate reductase [Desulforhopalus singaporensis]|uniref:Methylenetetrahydrofolate reductase n=1 Tax=Desulforhopalus singaporensis TaxID=91360 RepID=A0A1H0MUZ4_9BACT|nr:methylenetetrahydrofolate reductase [Desulforhopalus singaporensis]SDO84192.1 5,10-methylenetetrahydrofolate reductase [Desulforhopalus singaporensis]